MTKGHHRATAAAAAAAAAAVAAAAAAARGKEKIFSAFCVCLILPTTNLLLQLYSFPLVDQISLS